MSSIKSYLAVVRFEQSARGHPAPPMTLSMARLKLVQTGVARVQAERPRRTRLPITPVILMAQHREWVVRPPHERALLWEVATLAFFGFFPPRGVAAPIGCLRSLAVSALLPSGSG